MMRTAVLSRRNAVSGDYPDAVALGAIDVDGVAPGPCARAMARKEPYRDVLAGGPGATPSTVVAPQGGRRSEQQAKQEKESACKPGSVESSHSSAMRVAAHL